MQCLFNNQKFYHHILKNTSLTPLFEPLLLQPLMHPKQLSSAQSPAPTGFHEDTFLSPDYKPELAKQSDLMKF